VIFKEYAIQPDVLNTNENCRFWLSLMGLEKGRQISRYPKRWKRLVYDSLINCKPREKKYVEDRLFNLPNNVLKKRIHNWDPNPTVGWIKNAVAEHNRNPFHAIIATENPDRSKKVLIANEEDDTHELLIANSNRSIIRDLNGITGWVKQLLEQSNLIVFIDPFFSPSNGDYLIVLKRFTEIIISSIPNGSNKKIQFHSRNTIGGTKNHFINECTKKIKPMTEDGLEIAFYRWPDNEIHNRFILTGSHGGVSYNYGLGIGSPNHDMNDEINYLSEDTYQKRWDQYVKTDKKPVCIIGK